MPFKVGSGLGQAFIPLSLLQHLSLFLSSYNSDIGNFKSRSILKKKTETRTWFLLQRQADRCDMRMDMPPWLLSTALCPVKDVKHPETKGRRLFPGHS